VNDGARPGSEAGPTVKIPTGAAMVVEAPADQVTILEPETLRKKRRLRLGRIGFGSIGWCVGLLVLALGVRIFLVQMYWIPSVSMEPTLVSGDRVLVRKFGDITHPARGEVVVFDGPPAARADFDHLITRVVGLAGESIAFENGKVFVNDKLLDEPYLAAGTQSLPGTTPCSRAQPCLVPPGHVWVMGDNRARSHDSRYADVGPIDQSTIVGRAFVVNWPPDRLSGL
jgi:signal peptidase I